MKVVKSGSTRLRVHLYPLVVALLGLLAGISASIAADKQGTEKPKPYPLKKCVVSDEKLGDHGKPYVFTHQGQEIKMCCKGCVKDFEKEPSKYLKKIEQEAKKQKEKK